MTSSAYKREQVFDIINSVISRIKAPAELSRDALHQELGELKSIIETLRHDLHAAQPGEISEKHIPTATDELDAVIEHTESATGTIMDSCDGILTTLKDADPAHYSQVEKYVVQIFEACTFQDITGQRIKKVTNSLKQIDAKIKSVLGAIDGQLAAAPIRNETTEASLLNGPALPADAVSQDDIDRLLAEFDSKNGA